MATEKEVEFSALCLRRIIVEPEVKTEIKMEGQDPETDSELPGTKESCLVSLPAETVPRGSPPAPLRRIKQEASAGPSWEDQWPEFLQVSQSPRLGQEDPLLPENMLREEAEISPDVCEGTEAVRLWRRGEDGSRLRPRIHKTAPEIRDLNFACEKGDRRLREDQALDLLSSERQRRRFRHFGYQEVNGPWEAYCQLRKFCHQWLMPERHTKEEILELVILEQFLSILPQEMLCWIQERDSESCFHAVALAEHFLLRQREAERQDQPQQQMLGMKEEAAVNFSARDDESLDMTVRHFYREIKQEGEDDPSVLAGDGRQNDSNKPLSETENREALKESVSKQGELKGFEGQEAEELRSDSTTNLGGGLGETTPQQIVAKGKRPSDRLFQSLNRNQKSNTGEELYECSDCGKEFISRAGFIMHIRIHGREKPYECSDCGKHFRRSSHLNSHSKIHAGVKPFKCSDCGKGFSRSSNLISHQRMHTGEKPYACSSCTKQFCDKSSLIRHERLHTGDKPYKCTECGKSFSQSHHLITHQRSHTGEKPYKCLLCSKSFCDRSTYIRHQKNHTGEKTFKCLDCGECFSRNKHLVRHRSIHTARELYTCSDCGESFGRRSGLKMHQKIHTGEKPFECSDCGKKFNRSTNLISHQRIHTGERPYGCPDCGKRFNRRTHLVSHQKIHGPRKETPEALPGGEDTSSVDLKGGYLPPSYIITTIV
uniref:Uncharacterized protein isoform X1 n=1 Tax=Pogona vitticeps TaxID=103695 RepID=A0ABM5FGY8_9SAUR